MQKNVREVKSGYLPDNDITYVEDMLEYMEFAEQKRRYNLNLLSPQISWRRDLVEWICMVAEKLNVGRCATHLAIKLLDNFMDGHDIEEHRLHLVSIGCLRIATKFEEKDSSVPKLNAISALLPEIHRNSFTKSEYTTLEVMIMKYFQWNVYTPTANHFVDMLIPLCTSQIDLCVNVPEFKGRFEEAKKRFSEYVSYFLDVSLQELTLAAKLPSLVAAAIIYCSREACQLNPWPLLLEGFSGLRPSNFMDCANILTAVYKNATRLRVKLSITNQTTTPLKYIKATSNKRRLLSAEDNKIKCRKVTINLTPLSEEDINVSSGIPMKDSGSRSLGMIRDIADELPVIDLSPDDGYLTMSCSSLENCSDDSANFSIADLMSAEQNKNKLTRQDLECRVLVKHLQIDDTFYAGEMYKDNRRRTARKRRQNILYFGSNWKNY